MRLSDSGSGRVAVSDGSRASWPRARPPAPKHILKPALSPRRLCQNLFIKPAIQVSVRASTPSAPEQSKSSRQAALCSHGRALPRPALTHRVPARPREALSHPSLRPQPLPPPAFVPSCGLNDGRHELLELHDESIALGESNLTAPAPQPCCPDRATAVATR